MSPPGDCFSPRHLDIFLWRRRASAGERRRWSTPPTNSLSSHYFGPPCVGDCRSLPQQVNCGSRCSSVDAAAVTATGQLIIVVSSGRFLFADGTQLPVVDGTGRRRYSTPSPQHPPSDCCSPQCSGHRAGARPRLCGHPGTLLVVLAALHHAFWTRGNVQWRFQPSFDAVNALMSCSLLVAVCAHHNRRHVLRFLLAWSSSEYACASGVCSAFLGRPLVFMMRRQRAGDAAAARWLIVAGPQVEAVHPRVVTMGVVGCALGLL